MPEPVREIHPPCPCGRPIVRCQAYPMERVIENCCYLCASGQRQPFDERAVDHCDDKELHADDACTGPRTK